MTLKVEITRARPRYRPSPRFSSDSTSSFRSRTVFRSSSRAIWKDVQGFFAVGALARLSLWYEPGYPQTPAPHGYPQTPHTLYARFHSSEGLWKPKSVRQSHSRFSRRFGGTYSNLASRGSSHITHGSHLRLAEVHPPELERFIHRIGRIHQQIRLP